MASDNEPAKLLLPYLQRADELQKHEPLVAYYCNSLSCPNFFYENKITNFIFCV